MNVYADAAARSWRHAFPKLTPRGRALRWLTRHRGITEQPPGSNKDEREDGIRAAQLLVANHARYLIGAAWCGTWAAAAAIHAGVRIPNPERWASVAYIEDDATAHRNGFRGWTRDPKRVLRGDLVVLFGRGVHVATVRRVFPRLGLVLTDEGNTSSGPGGPQANGDGAVRRRRRLADVHGFALVDYPDA